MLLKNLNRSFQFLSLKSLGNPFSQCSLSSSCILKEKEQQNSHKGRSMETECVRARACVFACVCVCVCEVRTKIMSEERGNGGGGGEEAGESKRGPDTSGACLCNGSASGQCHGVSSADLEEDKETVATLSNSVIVLAHNKSWAFGVCCSAVQLDKLLPGHSHYKNIMLMGQA